MITTVLIFAGSLLLLHLFDSMTDLSPTWFGLHRTYVKVNLAFLTAAAFTTEKMLAGAPRDLVFTLFVVIAVADTFWAGYLGQKERRKQQ
jgi:hypothetical protein